MACGTPVIYTCSHRRPSPPDRAGLRRQAGAVALLWADVASGFGVL